jgi:hypothetical protein
VELWNNEEQMQLEERWSFGTKNEEQTQLEERWSFGTTKNKEQTQLEEKWSFEERDGALVRRRANPA